MSQRRRYSPEYKQEAVRKLPRPGLIITNSALSDNSQVGVFQETQVSERDIPESGYFE
jgi:hypothetical protein